MMEDEERQKKLQAGKAKPESEVSTTAEDCSSEEEDLQQSEAQMEPDLQSGGPQSRIQIMEDELAAKSMAMEELSRELEEIRAAFGAEGVQQLQDFEEALKQRDEIITQLTANLQQARTEKEEVMREFLELTEQSQKLQIQFQQLQAGEILRSSNISSTAADLLQARQQITLYQQQLDERDAQVRGHQEKMQEQLLLIAQLQERLSEAERVRTQADESFAQSLREKDLLNTEQQRLITQLQDQLLTSKQQVEEFNKHLAAKTQELENCEKELSSSRQKERMSSGEILQLMKTVEDLQQRCHQGGQSESETIQRIEDNWNRQMEQLRAELDEMYGQQIVQMKQELRMQHATEVERIQTQHSSETEKIVQQHQSELERFKGQLFQSAGGVNVLNVKVIELQQKLQETQVLREKAEQELAQTRADKLNVAQQVERLRAELQSTRAEIQSPEKMQMLHDAISDLQMQLEAAHKANGDLEGKHESEITNYKIKLDMLEREKDAVLDRMAESQEAELERLRTQLLFSHEEELSRLRDDLQRESQLNVENLRDEMAVRHREALDDFGDKLRTVESERSALASERLALLQEIVALKNDLNRALESQRAEDLVVQLKELQTEVEHLRAESGQKESGDELTSLKNEREHLLQKNQQMCTQLKDLQDEIEKQRNTFSFAEKNFEVNYQELKDEYTCLVNAKLQLEQRLIKETMEYETKLRELQTRHEEVDGKTLIEKDTSELMEKLQMAENEKKSLAEQLLTMQTDMKKLEDELKKTRVDKGSSELMEKLETAENEKKSLAEQLSKMQTDVKHLEDELKKMPIEKDSSELMEKLQMAENEKKSLVEQLSTMQMDMKRLEDELKKTLIEKDSTELMEKLEVAENENKNLVERLSQMEMDAKRLEDKLKKMPINEDSSELTEKLEMAENENKNLTEQLSTMQTDMKRLEDELKKTLIEKDSSELMEKLEMEKNEKKCLVERLSQMEMDAKRLEDKLKKMPIEKDSSELMEKLETAENEKTCLAEQLSVMQTDMKRLEDELKKTLTEKDSTELMEKLEVAENENRNLVERLSQMETDAKQLKAELKKTPIKKDTYELMEKLETAENEKKNLAERLSLMNTELEMLKGGRSEDLGSRRHALDCSVAGGLCSVETHHAHIRSLREELDVLRSSLEEKERLEATRLRCDDPSSPTAAQQPQPQEGRRRETPASTPAHRLALHTHAGAAAHEDQLSASGRLPEQHRSVSVSSAAVYDPQVETGDAQADGDADRASLMMQPQEMDGAEHDECRLQLEAQRISLSQIHAAQLELLRESLFAQTQAQLLSREQELQDAHEQELRRLREEMRSEQQGLNGHPAELKESSVQQLKAEFQECSARLEERHRQEIERLKSYYQQQMEETQERFTAEILLLQQRLQELTGARELFSVPSVCAPLTGDERREHLQVIVQMSVEFAQQTEQARISKQARETSTAIQTDISEDEEAEEDQLNSVSLMKSHEEEPIYSTEHKTGEDEEVGEESEIPSETFDDDLEEEQEDTEVPADDDDDEEDFRSELVQQEEEHGRVLEALRSSHARQLEVYQEQNTLLTAQIHTLNQQLLQKELELQQIKEREDETDRRRDQQLLPSMRSCGTQTEQANVRLRQVLIDVLKTTAAVEETIGRHVEGILEASSKAHLRSSWQKEAVKAYGAPTAGDASSESFHGSEAGADDVSLFSAETETDEGLEMSLKIQGAELQLQEAELPLEREEYLMSISTRLQSAVEKLLITITDTSTQVLMALPKPLGITQDDMDSYRTYWNSHFLRDGWLESQDMDIYEVESRIPLPRPFPFSHLLHERNAVVVQTQISHVNQRDNGHLLKVISKISLPTPPYTLEHARITQTELMREKFRHNEEMEELLRRQEELQERLGEEARAREQLALELHKAEGLIDGYTGERLALEQQVRERAELQLHLEQELRVTGSRLRELEQERQQIQDERELLSRQQDAMRDGAGPRELHLLEETEKLMAEKVEVQRQAQKESGELLLQVKQLEAELEEQVSRVQELQETHSTETADLRQQIQALEKQLEKNRKFMDEQAADREHERDVFQQEIHNLEQQLKNPTKTQTGSDRRDREVQELNAALQEKSDWCSELLLSSEQLQRDVHERDEEIETLGARVRELEHTLMHRIVNLEEQLEQFREELENKSEEVNQLHMQLEIQRKEISSHQQDLQAQARLAQVLEEKDRQIAVLNEQLAKRQRTGTDPDKEVVEVKDEALRELEAQVECLRSEQERLKRNNEEEVEQLNAVIEKLQQELSHIEHKQQQDEAKDEYDEMKQKMDEVTTELDTLKSAHRSLRSQYERLQEETVTELEEALREKTAAFVVVQAQVQALEESAGSRVTSLSRRVEELETSVEEKDSELRACRLKVEQAQTDADALYAKVAQLEDKLREKVAAVLVSQAQLEAVQTQTKELHAEAHAGEATGPSAQLRSEGLTAQDGASTPASAGKVNLLTERLKELEEGLSGMQKDQELQKQLLSSSEEEVVEYERRLGVMIDLLNQMRTKPTHHRPLTSTEVSDESGQSMSELMQELQEVKGQVASTKEELNCFRELSHKLQEDIEMKESTITQLQTTLSQEREMSLALLKDQLHRASQEGDRSTAELLQELQEVKGEAAATKEELNSYRERSLKLQEEIEVRDVSIAELKDKVQELQTTLAKSSEELLLQQPPSQPKKKGDNREHHGTDRSTDARKDKPSITRTNSTDRSESSSSANGTRGPSRVDACTQTEPSGAEEVEEMMAGYEEKIGQMQELHAAEIMDMEARHIAESESLKRENQQLEDECRALRDAVHKLRTAEGPSVRSERPSVSPFKDGYASDSSSDWSQRTGYDQAHLQQEYRSTPEGARRDVEPDVLPDRIKVDGDWRAELLTAVQQVFVDERDVLKNVLYSHLERLDTADAVIHLNQLERALAEQDARHRELMGVLCSADRNSLRSEIQQLRDQLHTLTAEQTQRHHQDTAGLESEREVKAMPASAAAAEVDTLNDRLAQEQKRARELQWAFEKEKCKSDRKEETDREEVEDLKLSLEEQRGRVAELCSSLEKERQISAELREQVDGQQAREVSVSSELQLDAQRARSLELSSALEKEKELNAQLLQRLPTSSTSNPREPDTQNTLKQAEATCSQVEAGVLSVESLLQTLQTQLAEKQAQVVQMMEKLERQKLDAVQHKRQWDEEKSALARTAAQDQNALRVARDSLSGLERRADELWAELDAERDSVRRLERDRDRLQGTVRQLEDRLRAPENNQSGVRSDAQPEDRTRDWVLQAGDALTLESSTTSLRETGQSSDPKHMDNILSRLQLIAAKINSLTSETPSRLSGEALDRDSLAWLHSNVQDVMSLLQHIPSAPSALPESAALLVGGSSSLLNERLLRQNAELTGFVSRLTEEKNDLRNQLLKLEEELRRYRQKKTTAESVSSRSGVERQDLVLFSSERESWAQERNRLEKSLRQAEAELNRLRGEIRSDSLRDLTGADLDNAALRRMYGKYLRAESFRKALIYQKKYLLLLLGGFQECEEATLSLIARMGGHPAHTCLETVGHHRRGFTRFRSAVRVSIALSRMRFLVKRWQRAAGGNVTSPIVSRNGLAQITGVDVRNESSYLQPGGVEVFRERRTTSRGRTGRDSPRSAASLQHRFHTMAGDAGGLPCSHLQNYDPDRALTDYISRLEALQRRLGSVQSGNHGNITSP
ncbi:A-kinase anchor 9-like protein [Labeo rohita]|uniref:A-kinase anchor 9-like protein n=1 Tax=Labeo rohita TaxID=84645 RepID=A0A498M9G7_LABRO|nr:A-kinase anchor 9-like protein [Labeo rohita]